MRRYHSTLVFFQIDCLVYQTTGRYSKSEMNFCSKRCVQVRKYSYLRSAMDEFQNNFRRRVFNVNILIWNCRDFFWFALRLQNS